MIVHRSLLSGALAMATFLIKKPSLPTGYWAENIGQNVKNSFFSGFCRPMLLY
jgi:hypothetical protein